MTQTELVSIHVGAIPVDYGTELPVADVFRERAFKGQVCLAHTLTGS